MAIQTADLSILVDQGVGSVGDPYGTSGNHIQYAMDNGLSPNDTLNLVGAGTAAYSGVDLNFGTFGVTDPDNMLLVQGFGIQAPVNLGGAIGITASGIDGVAFGNCDISGGTGAWQVNSDNFITLFRCKIDGGGITGGVTTDLSGHILECEVTNTSGGGIVSSGSVRDCFVTQNSNNLAIQAAQVEDNIVIITHTGNESAVEVNTDGGKIKNNTVFSTVASTGTGIATSAAFLESAVIENNYVEGFSGTGGLAFEVVSGSMIVQYTGNRSFNCTTTDSIIGIVVRQANNSVTAASGLVNASAADYRPTFELIGTGGPTSFLNLSGNERRSHIGAIPSNISARLVGSGGLVG